MITVQYKSTCLLTYKLQSLTYKILTTTQPSYLHNLRSHEKKTSTQHLLFILTLALPTISSLLQITHCSFRYDPDSASSDPAINTQNEFNHFYAVAHKLMEQFYPEQTVTPTSRDPSYITPAIKSMLCRKNKLMRAIYRWQFSCH